MEHNNRNKYDWNIDDRINELISHYPEDKRKSVYYLFYEVQDATTIGCTELMDKVAEIFKFYLIEVYEVVSFTMYNQNHWKHVWILPNLHVV
jgi:NADH-quinone oxidoreductase subunit E